MFCGINLSLELAGFVNLEMASRMCPVICAESFGAGYLLRPSQNFRVDLETSSFNLLYEHINNLLLVILQSLKRKRCFNTKCKVEHRLMRYHFVNHHSLFLNLQFIDSIADRIQKSFVMEIF